MTGDTPLRVFPPVVAMAAATARAAGQNAVAARNALTPAPVEGRLTPGAGAALARMRAGWLGELDRIAATAAALGDAAEAAADDYVLTDRLALTTPRAG